MDYQKFKNDFEKSGLSQRAYAEQKLMSSSMVSYYLRRARALSKPELQGQFQEVTIKGDPTISRQLTITMPEGVVISIPI